MLRMLERACGVALNGQQSRKYFLGAIGLRKDGAIVTATNGGTKGERTPTAHAEYRLSRKLDSGAVVYVARVLKNSAVALARPCMGCQIAMRNRGVSKCYYTISENEYGCIVF